MQVKEVIEEGPIANLMRQKNSTTRRKGSRRVDIGKKNKELGQSTPIQKRKVQDLKEFNITHDQKTSK